MMNANRLALDYMNALASNEYWGNVTFKFQKGLIIHITQEQSMKPEETVPGYRRNYGHNN